MLNSSLVMQVKVAGKLGVVYQLHRGSAPEGVTLHAKTCRQDTASHQSGKDHVRLFVLHTLLSSAKCSTNHDQLAQAAF